MDAQKQRGRTKGSKNRYTKSLRDDILEAYERVGGVEYLEMLAKLDPRTFSNILVKILPTQVTGADGGAVKIEVITGIDRSPDDPLPDDTL
jgi:hypothetical protein